MVESLDIDDWYVMITDQTTEVWVEVDVVTCNPGAVCTPDNNDVQTDNPESHNAVSSSQAFGKWSEPGRIGEDANGAQSNRRPAFEDKNWCNNMMSTNGGVEVAWSESPSVNTQNKDTTVYLAKTGKPLVTHYQLTLQQLVPISCLIRT